MWTLIPKKKFPPTRVVRYCCAVFKEMTTPNRMAVLGVRSAESPKRQGRDVFAVRGGSYKEAKFFSLDHTSEVFNESLEMQDDVWDCTLIKNMKEQNDTIVNPIYDWLETDIWEYIKQENLQINPLYYEGYKRVGCIGCPLATNKERWRDFEKYPEYKLNYIKAFQRMHDRWDENNIKKRDVMNNGEEIFDWWMEKYKYDTKGQMTIDDFIKED